MTHPSKITDMKALCVGYLLWQFRASPNLVELIEIFADEVQSCEDTYHELVDERTLDDAVGAQLDQYGTVCTWPRAGLDDDEYRSMLKVANVMHATHGDIETASYVISKLVEVPVRYIQKGQAHAEWQWLRATALPQENIDLLNSIMDRIVPAGVSWSLVEGVTSESEPAKQFDTAGAGFDGGHFARRIDVL